jgi:hypothetical protein
VTSPLAICPDPTASDELPATVDALPATADEGNEEGDAEWYDDEAIGGGSSGFADAPQGW